MYYGENLLGMETSNYKGYTFQLKYFSFNVITITRFTHLFSNCETFLLDYDMTWIGISTISSIWFIHFISLGSWKWKSMCRYRWIRIYFLQFWPLVHQIETGRRLMESSNEPNELLFLWGYVPMDEVRKPSDAMKL